MCRNIAKRFAVVNMQGKVFKLNARFRLFNGFHETKECFRRLVNPKVESSIFKGKQYGGENIFDSIIAGNLIVLLTHFVCASTNIKGQ